VWMFFVAVGSIFGTLAAAIAFVITYDEWSHHLLPRGEILKKSFQMAAVTLGFFWLLSIVLGAVLTPHQLASVWD
jgi:hypothetical protein